MKAALILLSGGKGLRMGSSVPKQYLHIHGKPIILHSLETFQAIPEIQEIIIVCPLEYQPYFPGTHRFASPGRRRQDSVFNGLREVRDAELICVHDGARPFVKREEILNVLKGGRIHGASVLGTKVTNTIKQCDREGKVKVTLNRETLWEVQTPQVVHKNILEKGFEIAYQKNLDVTDDVSLAELAQSPVHVIAGSPDNIKITKPSDLELSEVLL